MTAEPGKPTIATQNSLDAEDLSSPRPPRRIVLRADGLKKAYDGQVVLDNVSLALHEGEVVFLRGDNGSGKTTLLNILTGYLPPDAGVIDYRIDDAERAFRFPRSGSEHLIPFTPDSIARGGVGRTWQDIRLFTSQTLRQNIAVGSAGHPGDNPLLPLLMPARCRRAEAEVQRKTRDLLERFGLAARADARADRVSLGESKRAAIARAVVTGARVLFLDEPLSGLDAAGIKEVMHLLSVLVREHHITLVIIEHIFSEPHLDDLVTTDWILANGGLKRSSGERVTEQPAIASARSSAHLPSWVPLLCQEDDTITEESLGRGASLVSIRRPPPHTALLEIRDLVVDRGGRTIVGRDASSERPGFNLVVHRGAILVLCAPNGWGKSTLFHAITGLLTPRSGSIWIDGEDVRWAPTWRRVRRGLVALPSGQALFPSLRADEVLRLSRVPEPRSAPSSNRRVVSSLSGGERQRLALDTMARGFVRVYDEPFSALDESGTAYWCAHIAAARDTAQLIFVPVRH